jgi:hypothetical protein
VSSAVYTDQRLPLEALAPEFRRHVDPASPAPVRMAAARALVPMPPAQLVTAVYMLATDPDPKVAAGARATLDDFPGNVMRPALSEALDVRILDYLAQKYFSSPDYIDSIVMNAGTADETIQFLATKCKERQLELIATNQVRLLRHPKIIEGLYFNPQTRMSTVDRVIDFAVRAGVWLEGIPAFKEAVQALGLEMPVPGQAPEVPVGLEEVAPPLDEATVAPATQADAAFSSFLKDGLTVDAGRMGGTALDDLESMFGGDEATATGLEADDGLAGFGSAEADDELAGYGSAEAEKAKAAAEAEAASKGRAHQISKMSVSQRVRLALLGTKTDRSILIRDRVRSVCMATIKSPKINDAEAAKYAGMRNIDDEIIRFISAKKHWLKSYQVKLALCANPKTPPSNAMRLLPFLRKPDVKRLAADRNISPVVQNLAKKMTKARMK